MRLRGKPRDRALVDAPPIEREDARQSSHHVVQVLEHPAGYAVVDDLANGAAIERGHGRPARHRFGEHEPERLAGLNRIEERACSAVELHLGVEVRLTEIDDVDRRPRAGRLSPGSRLRLRPREST